MVHRRVSVPCSLVVLCLASAACGPAPVGTDDAGADAAPTSSAQLPPTTGRVDVEAWIATGAYLQWHCETAHHDARSPSPHGINRICSNDVLAAAADSGEVPVGAAGVKELYDATGANIVGYAVYRKVRADSGTDGSAWYWYERVPADSAAPHDTNGVVADGTGASGTAMSICVGCHTSAGPGTMGHDFVFTQVH